MVADTERAVPPTPTLTAEQIDMLRKLGFDHVPTVEELAEAKTQRQAEVREEVLFQADRRGWCADGTRTVLANLRLQRPGDKAVHKIVARVEMDIEVDLRAWTERGALAYAVSANILPTAERSADGQVSYTNMSITGLKVGDTPYELTEDLRRELRNDGE